MHKILRVNMSTRQYHLEEMSESYEYLGGRGLTSEIINQEVPCNANPLGKKNKLVLAAGILAGTTVPNSGRLSVGTKSPLTKGIKESNAGGSAAQKLARLGIQAVVIEGCAKELISIKIGRNGVKFLPSKNLKGLGNYALIDRLKKKHGNKISVISIGQAGEMKLKAACVSVTSPDFRIRVAGRGGTGAVMGSKKLKAIVIDDSKAKGVQIADRKKLKIAVSSLVQGITSHPMTDAFKDFGTPMLVSAIGSGLGTLATKNYSLGKFEGADKISGEYLAELIENRPNARPSHRCMSGCIMSCSNVFTDENGKEIVSGLEFETLALMGSNCMIDDIDIIGRMNRVCNDVGVDTMDVGGAIAVAMESGMLDWGDGETALKFVNEIAKGTAKGKMLGNGCEFTGEKLGVKRIPVVKGQCLAGYDPRGLKGTGVTYATSAMGADHTCGNALPSPSNPDYDHLSPNKQAVASKFLQTYHAAIDSLGICLFASLSALDNPELQDHFITCVSAVQGRSLKEDYLFQMGTSVLQTERAFNKKAGFTKKDDRLPKFFTKEPLPPGNHVFDVPEEDLDHYLEFRVPGGFFANATYGHQLTGKLVGKSVIYNYSSGEVLGAYFKDETTVEWWGPKGGSYEGYEQTDHYRAFEIRPDILYVVWWEGGTVCSARQGIIHDGLWQVSMVLDLKKNIATDAYTNPDEKGNPIPILDQARVEIREGKMN